MFKTIFAMLALCAGTVSAGVNWELNFVSAQQQAATENKALVFAFVGSDWCPWCKRMDREVWSDPAFSEAVGDEFIFVFIDSPRRKRLSDAQEAHNDELFDRFQVNGVPTIVVLAPGGQTIGRTGYRQGGATAFASYLQNMVQQWSNTRMETLSGAVLGAAANLGNSPLALLQRYKELVNEGKRDTDAAIVVREQLMDEALNRAPDWQYEVAMLDYKELTATPDPERDVTAAVAPLLGFLKKHGKTDAGHAWRLNMIISQVYMGDQRFEEALEYAHRALEQAPEDQQAELRAMVRSLKDSQVR